MNPTAELEEMNKHRQDIEFPEAFELWAFVVRGKDVMEVVVSLTEWPRIL